MSLSIRAADRGNRAALEALRVAPGQEGYIETVAQCLREADGLDYGGRWACMTAKPPSASPWWAVFQGKFGWTGF